jgi:hypothetical protein
MDHAAARLAGRLTRRTNPPSSVIPPNPLGWVLDDEAPQLKRGFLGYSRGNVQRLLTDREAMFSRAADDLRAAEDKVAHAEERARLAEDAASDAEDRARSAMEAASEAEQRSTAAEAEVARLRDELEDVRSLLEETSRAVGETPATADGHPATEGIRSVLEATQEAVASLIEGARREGEESLKDAERRRALVQSEIDQLSEWWGGIQPLVMEVRGSIDQAREHVAALQDRIGGAFQPVTSAFGELGGRLEALAQMAARPVGDRRGETDPAPTNEEGAAINDDGATASAVPAAEDDVAPSVVIEVDAGDVAVASDREGSRRDERSAIGRGRRSSWR